MKENNNQINRTDPKEKIRTVFPLLRTFIVPDMDKSSSEEISWKPATGFIVEPRYRKEHEQEFPGLYRYNLEAYSPDEGTGWKCLNDRIDNCSTLLYTTEPVKMLPGEYYEGARKGYVQGESINIKMDRKPTRDEVKAFCAHPKMVPLLKDFSKNYLPFDVNGERIRPAESWNALVERAETDKLMKENLELLERTITAPVTDKNGKTFQVDFNLAEPLQRILNAGYHTGQSDSGTVTDHPNQRYVEDSELGIYRKGDPLPPGCTAYLTFWLPEAQGVPTNTERQVKHIEEQAQASGWCVERMPIFGQPSLRLTLPETMDGTSSLSINREASAAMRKKHPEITIDSDLRGYFDMKDIEEQAIIDRHGGTVRWTDGEVLERWKGLAARLEWCMQIENTTGWLTANDVHSVLLDKETAGNLYREHEDNRKSIVEANVPKWRLYHEMESRVYDEVARKHGFDGFDENSNGTAVRNYTALHKPADRQTKERLKAFDAEMTERLQPLLRFADRISRQTDLLLKNEGQRYLQAIHALTASILQRRQDNERLSDISVYKNRNNPYDVRYNIRCRIDGELQFSKELNRNDSRLYFKHPDQVDLQEWAARYYRKELDQPQEQEQTRGLRR